MPEKKRQWACDE
ncbi:hypothetical protein CGLO_17986 [Colletotrichum gloeosporioides Cg-14]|uniref:Uncharacterized protein n=1 Tax=Colletotrichum gloeosporioides (strain Cg-14) TaxID=1237896 RepID=T0JVE1_COLGC|nr:hypothetical protein CGLO_17986 [Colletotrichum gloeosporioides Cg-14]